MSRQALTAAALTATALLLAGCGSDSKDAAGTTTATTTTTPTTTSAQPDTATPAAGTFVFYAKPTRAQFIDHNDDRERGDFTNPFDPDLLPTPPNANTAGEGGRAGDNALFSFKIYTDQSLTHPIGTAIYSCTFNFDQEATCEANFTLTNGTMIALGPAQLKSPNMTLPVTGGTGNYNGAHGQLTSKPAAGTNTQIIRFQLL